MADVNGALTLMHTTCKMSKQGYDSFSDVHLYKFIVGALQYLTLTRSNISFSVNKAFQPMAAPLTSH